MNKRMTTALAMALCLASTTAGAALLTSAPSGGTTTVLTTLTGDWDASESVVAGGFTVTAPDPDLVWYGDVLFAFSGNGVWSEFAWVGGVCFEGSCTATIDLGGTVSSAGGFMNYAPGFGAPVIAAIAADGTTVLEWYDLEDAAPISTPDGFNAGAFRGISRASADIAFFRISGSFLLIHDLTVDGEIAVPEPGALALLGLGLFGVAAARRRRR